MFQSVHLSNQLQMISLNTYLIHSHWKIVWNLMHMQRYQEWRSQEPSGAQGMLEMLVSISFMSTTFTLERFCVVLLPARRLWPFLLSGAQHRVGPGWQKPSWQTHQRVSKQKFNGCHGLPVASVGVLTNHSDVRNKHLWQCFGYQETKCYWNFGEYDCGTSKGHHVHVPSVRDVFLKGASAWTRYVMSNKQL